MNIQIDLNIKGIEPLVEALNKLASGNVLVKTEQIERVNAEPETSPNPEPKIDVPNAAPIVPVAETQSYSFEDIQKCCAELARQEGMREKMLEIIHSFGCVAITEIPKERYGEFAKKLRDVGGVI